MTKKHTKLFDPIARDLATKAAEKLKAKGFRVFCHGWGDVLVGDKSGRPIQLPHDKVDEFIASQE